ncbi:MAG: signal recognition particle-docking protein FtsY [Butyrivibrio sp.]|nr:signal recognition particle-docking protein FtsY [Butyrivibrio sp.]
MANGFFAKLSQGLTKTRDNIVKGIDNVFRGYSSIDEDFYEELEETLIMGDIGVNATSRIMDQLREQVKSQRIHDPAQCKQLLLDNIREQMKTDEHAYDFEDQKTVIFVIGVNGVGKTTSVGKLAAIFKNRGKKVIIAAADTYRAAATEQLKEWADRAECPLIAGREGADPASVIYDAVGAFKARNCDILIVDTAGRLHNKKNLMEELAKMNRIIDKELSGICRENFIVLDGTTGQNAINQAREFGEAANLTGIVLTKLDGTAKGGIAVAIVSELNIPVKYIGVGEGIDDLERFNSDEFVDALFDRELERDEDPEESEVPEESMEEEDENNG